MRLLLLVRPWLSLIVLTVLGAWAFVRWSRRVAGRWGAPLVAAVFLTHVALAVALFFISSWHLPVLSELQLGGGFWAFSRDSDGYHFRALSVLAALESGHLMMPDSPTGAYELFVALQYLCFGVLPLVPIVVNCWLVTAAGLAGHDLVKKLGGGGAAALGGFLAISCWPSGFIWASQLLRDSLALALTFFALLLAVSSLERLRRQGRAATFILLSGSTAAVTTVRPYAGWLLALAALGLGASLVAPRVRRLGGQAIVFVLVATSAGAVLGTGSRLARTFTENFAIANALPPRSGASATSGAAAPDETALGNSGSSTARSGGRSAMRGEGGAGPDEDAPELGSALRIVPKLFEQKRQELAVGSHSVVQPSADIRTWPALIAFLPQGLAHALFAPFPWDLSPGKSTGFMKTLAVLESLLMILACPIIVLGVVRSIAAPALGTSLLLLFSLSMLVLLSLIEPNLGGLVRLRGQAVLPLLLLGFVQLGVVPDAQLRGVAARIRRVLFRSPFQNETS